MNTSILTSIRRFLTKMLLFPLFVVVSLILYPNIVLQYFFPSSKGHKEIEHLVETDAIIKLPGNAAAQPEAFYAPVSWYWPFFSLEEHISATIEKIKSLASETNDDGEQKYSNILVSSESMGGAVAVTVMAELLRMKKEGKLELKTKVKFLVSNTFSKLETVVLGVINRDALIFYMALPILLVALPSIFASLVFSIPSAPWYLVVSLLMPALYFSLEPLIVIFETWAHGGGDWKDDETYVFQYLTMDTVIVLMTLLQMYCLTGTGFIVVPMVLCSILAPFFAQYTIPLVLETLGAHINIREHYEYICQHREEAKDTHGLEVKFSQVAARHDAVLGEGILCQAKDMDGLFGDKFLDQEFDHLNHMTVPDASWELF